MEGPDAAPARAQPPPISPTGFRAPTPSESYSPQSFPRRYAAPSSSAILGDMPASPTQLRRTVMVMSLPDLRKDAGSPKEGINSRHWTTEQKRLLHQKREREWLRQKGKHGYIDFSDAERLELKRYFDALATDQKISIERLEDMLISLGLAPNTAAVRKIVAKIDPSGDGHLGFEEYLEIFRGRADSEIFQVFKAMMEGRLGDRNLNFQTVISTYRRQLFIDATGARTMRPVRLPSDNVAMDQGSRILNNFAKLQRGRFQAAAARAEGSGTPMDKDLLPFETTGHIPPGGLSMVWRGIADQYHLSPSRPSSADRSKRLGVPPSPRTVINGIVKVPRTRKGGISYGSTIVIQAPALEEDSSSKQLVNTADLLGLLG